LEGIIPQEEEEEEGSKLGLIDY